MGPRAPKVRRRGTRLRRAGLGALPVLAGLLMASGLVRLGDGTAGAVLRGLGAVAVAATPEAPVQEEGADAGPDLDEILSALRERESQLDEREARLAAREARLSELEGRLQAQMAELTEAEDSLSRLLKLAETAADDDLTRLTTVYETMKAKEAAALFSQMEPAFAAGFLGRMRPEAAAAIMSGLDAETAYSISVMLAGRHSALRNGK